MTDSQQEADSPQPPDTSLTRRMVLKVAGLVSILSDTPGTLANTARAADTGITAAEITAAERTMIDDGNLGQHAQAIALDGTTALLGVPPSSAGEGPEFGRAAVLSQSEDAWTRQAMLSPDGDRGQFGRAVALDGDTAVIGGELGPDPTGDHAGSAAVFVRDADQWTRQATLNAPDAEGIDLFGTAVDVAGDTLVVGASGATTDRGHRSGAVYLYNRIGAGWALRRKLTPADATIENFGTAVAIDDDTAVVGGQRIATEESAGSGVAYIFERLGETWCKRTPLSPGDRNQDDGFGTAVSISKNTVIVGAPTETNTIGTNAGAAYVFARHDGQWHRESIIRNDNGDAYHKFGSTITVDGTVMMAGTASGGGPFVFIRAGGSWRQLTVRRAMDGESSGRGTLVEFDGDRALVTVDGRGTGPEHPGGSVEVFDL